jgi:hypothetical protein
MERMAELLKAPPKMTSGTALRAGKHLWSSVQLPIEIAVQQAVSLIKYFLDTGVTI